jgi:methyl-accepting chemotaxis protein
MVDLETTNWLLGVIALASAVQMLLLVGTGILGLKLYRQMTAAAAELETKHVAPLREQLDRILSDVHGITARVNQQTERVDHAISGTIDRVDETAERVKDSVREKVSRATGIVRGLRAVIMSLLSSESAARPPAAAGGRV